MFKNSSLFMIISSLALSSISCAQLDAPRKQQLTNFAEKMVMVRRFTASANAFFAISIRSTKSAGAAQIGRAHV